jgi:peptide deformylase
MLKSIRNYSLSKFLLFFAINEGIKILSLGLIILKIIIMILPIVGYGHPVLRKVGENISQEHPELKETIANMYDTMYNACGVGCRAAGR